MYLDPFEGREGAPHDTARAEPAHAGGRLNFARLWASVYRSRIAIGALILAGVALALVITMLMDPIYRATASVEMKLEAQKVLGTEAGGENQQEADRFLQTQLDIIRSRAMGEAVANDLGLFSDTRFLEQMRVEFDENDIPPRERQEARRRAVLGTLMGNREVELSYRTRIALIEFESPDPQLAARVANSFAQNFIRLNLRRKSDASSYSLEFLRDQLGEAQARLSESERRALDYARRTRIIDPGAAAQQVGSSGDTPRSLTTATLLQLNAEAASATARRIAAEQKWRRTSAANPLNVPEVLGNAAVQQLIQQRVALEAQYQEQLQRRQAEFPATRELAARIAELRQETNRLAREIQNSVQQEYRIASSQEQGVLDQLNELKTRTLNEQDQGIRLSILRREAQTNRQQFDSLLARYNQLNAESGVQLNNLSVVDTAEVPLTPVSPKLMLNFLLGILLGVAAAIAYVLGREQLFDMVRIPDDVTDRLGASLLGAVPMAQGDVMEDLNDSKSPVSEAFSAIRASMQFATPKGLPGSITVTSTQASEGKSTACFAMATSLAKIGRRIIVIDADLRRPNVHKLVGVKNGRGVAEILAGEVALDQAIVPDARAGVDVLTTGAIPFNPTDLLASEQFGALIRTLEERYDHVLVDSAPVLGLADAPLVASQTRATVFVIESGRTRVRGAGDAMKRITATGGRIAGVILSRFDPSKLGYGYEYQYGYSYSYGN